MLVGLINAGALFQKGNGNARYYSSAPSLPFRTFSSNGARRSCNES